MTIEQLYHIFLDYPSVETDSRKLKPGDLFFALKGPHFDGNAFAEKALESGASYAVVDEWKGVENDRIIVVPDSLKCLQQLAAEHRNRFEIPFLAITGSNGKTTTKELIHSVLSQKFRTYTTRGNLNNHIGIPLTILSIGKDAEIAVIEMGANHRQEIAGYCQYTRPTLGLITNIGKAHLEGFGGEEGVKMGKGELFEYLGAHEGLAFVNGADRNVTDVGNYVNRKIVYGGENSVVKAEIVGNDPFLEVLMKDTGVRISTHLVGSYNMPNILAAVAVGNYFGIGMDIIAQAVESYTPSNSRSQMLQSGSNAVIMDAYNANPGSMSAAIKNFALLNRPDKVLILGDMKELGVYSEDEHRAIVSLIDHYQWKAVALTGPVFSSVQKKYPSFDNSSDTQVWFEKQHFEHCTILVKGSRSMQMEKVVGEKTGN